MATVLLSISVCTVCVCVCVCDVSSVLFHQVERGVEGRGWGGHDAQFYQSGLEGNKSKLKRNNLSIQLETGKEQIEKQMQPNTKATHTHTHTQGNPTPHSSLLCLMDLPSFWPSGPAACLPASMQAHRCQCVSPVHAKKLVFCQK